MLQKELNLIGLNKTLALILWGQDKNGEDEVVVFSGVFTEKDGTFYLERENQESPVIQEDWLPRIKEVPEDLKDVLMGCEYQLSLSVGDIDEAPEPYEPFGLKWPQS